jgi:hypothetical protein
VRARSGAVDEVGPSDREGQGIFNQGQGPLPIATLRGAAGQTY